MKGKALTPWITSTNLHKVREYFWVRIFQRRFSKI